jgi:hypothetical protein
VGRLPNLLIIGAAKSGTTALHEYLSLHPSVFMSVEKEVRHFHQDDWRDRTDAYRTNFVTDLPVRGESSPGYSMHPYIPGVPARIHELIPDARLIYAVRDPVPRTVAQYVEFCCHRLEMRPFAEAMRDFDKPSNPYVMSSRYAYQLDQYREFFPDSQILVVDHHELLHRRADTLREVFEFVGVDPDFDTPAFDQLHNVREGKYRFTGLAQTLYERGLLMPLRTRSRVLPHGLRERIKSLLTEPVETPPLDPGLEAELKEVLRADVDRLRALTGKPFAGWSV